jgi:hypothetical protein
MTTAIEAHRTEWAGPPPMGRIPTSLVDQPVRSNPIRVTDPRPPDVGY